MESIRRRTDIIRDKNDDELTEAEITRWALGMLLKQRKFPFANGTVDAYINWGRWVADCSACNSGIACSPGVDTVICTDCGAKYSVVFPAEIERIEQALLARALRNRNWEPDETADDLEDENKRHGVEKEEA